jgi:hypothetical protein
VDEGPRALEYVSHPPRATKARGPTPDVVFLLGWMALFAACYWVMSVVAVGLGSVFGG